MVRSKEFTKLIIASLAIVSLTVACAEQKGFQGATFVGKADQSGPETDGGKDTKPGEGAPKTNSDRILGGDSQGWYERGGGVTTPLNPPASQEQDGGQEGSASEQDPGAPMGLDGTDNTNLVSQPTVVRDAFDQATALERAKETSEIILGLSLWAAQPKVESNGVITQSIDIQTYLNIDCEGKAIMAQGVVANDGKPVKLEMSEISEPGVPLEGVYQVALCSDEKCEQIEVTTVVHNKVEGELPYISGHGFAQRTDGAEDLLPLAWSSLYEHAHAFEEAQGNGVRSEECASNTGDENAPSEDKDGGSTLVSEEAQKSAIEVSAAMPKAEVTSSGANETSEEAEKSAIEINADMSKANEPAATPEPKKPEVSEVAKEAAIKVAPTPKVVSQEARDAAIAVAGGQKEEKKEEKEKKEEEKGYFSFF